MNSIVENYQQLQQHVKTSIITQNNNPQSIELIAVSKTFPVKDIITLHTNTGHIAFGENYVKELVEKTHELSSYPLQWHYIGSIQSNKIKHIAKHVSWVHSLSDAKHAIQLNRFRSSLSTKLNVLIEINISNDTNKHGLRDFNKILELAYLINSQQNLQLRGLMGMSGIDADSDTKNQQFAKLKYFFDKLKATPGFENIDTLSMGMSDDFELALNNGATMLRIGGRIFGKRN